MDVNRIIRGTNVTSSDERLKNNVKDMTGALASLTSLKDVTYKLKPYGFASLNVPSLEATINSKPDTGKVQSVLQMGDTALYNMAHIGFLTQDIQKVFPELVYADKDGILNVDYVSLIPVLVESIKVQQLVINDLKATIAELKKKVYSK